MHNHDNLIKTTYMTIKSAKLKKKSVFIGMLPNSHIYGVITQILGPLLLNGSVYYLENLDAENLVGAFKEYKPNIFPSVPKVYELLYSQILKKIQSKTITKVIFEKLFPICLKIRNKTGLNFGKYIFSAVQNGFGGKLKIMCSAGSPISKEVAEFFYGTGFKMLITYGATETNIPTIGNYAKNITMDSCGKNYPDVEIKIDDRGELLIKSPYMMLGYFNDEELTREAFTEDGWFKSGDLARINKANNVEILGRCKENIVLATGKKVAPDDIENNYRNIPYIKDMAICGIPAENGSYDEVHCFVVTEDGKQERARALLQEKSNNSSINMKILGIHFVDDIPRTALKKPKRYLLRKGIEESKKQIEVAKTKPVSLKEKIKEKSGIIIFPEGTRSKNGKLGECKKGAAMISLETKTPIIPAYIEGAYEIYPPSKKLPKLFNWKARKKYEVNVYYGKPITSEGKTIEQTTKEINDSILELANKFNKLAIV